MTRGYSVSLNTNNVDINFRVVTESVTVWLLSKHNQWGLSGNTCTADSMVAMRARECGMVQDIYEPEKMLSSFEGPKVHGNAFRLIGSFVRIHRLVIDSSHKWPATWSCDFFFDHYLDQLLNKQSTCRWFETPWRLCDVALMSIVQ